MKLLLIIALGILWIYLVILLAYIMIEIYWVNHPDKFKQSVIYQIERELELQSDKDINTPENLHKPTKMRRLVTR